MRRTSSTKMNIFADEQTFYTFFFTFTIATIVGAFILSRYIKLNPSYHWWIGRKLEQDGENAKQLSSLVYKHPLKICSWFLEFEELRIDENASLFMLNAVFKWLESLEACTFKIFVAVVVLVLFPLMTWWHKRWFSWRNA